MVSEGLHSIPITTDEFNLTALRSILDPLQKHPTVPQDQLVARLGCQGCKSAIFSAYQGPTDNLLVMSYGIKQMADENGIGYQMFQGGIRSSAKGNCAEGMCGIEQLREQKDKE